MRPSCCSPSAPTAVLPGRPPPRLHWRLPEACRLLSSRPTPTAATSRCGSATTATRCPRPRQSSASVPAGPSRDRHRDRSGPRLEGARNDVIATCGATARTAVGARPGRSRVHGRRARHLAGLARAGQSRSNRRRCRSSPTSAASTPVRRRCRGGRGRRADPVCRSDMASVQHMVDRLELLVPAIADRNGRPPVVLPVVIAPRQHGGTDRQQRRGDPRRDRRRARPCAGSAGWPGTRPRSHTSRTAPTPGPSRCASRR